jgi:hypothetical protein
VHRAHCLTWSCNSQRLGKGHFTHETKGPWPLHFRHSHWWRRWSQTKFASHYAWGTTGEIEWKMDVKSTWNPTWLQMVSCFRVTWTIFKKHLAEVGQTQSWKTMALQNLTTIRFLYFIMCEDYACIGIHWQYHLVEGQVTHDFIRHLRVHDHSTWLWMCRGTAFGYFFWALTISWSRCLAHVWIGPQLNL